MVDSFHDMNKSVPSDWASEPANGATPESSKAHYMRHKESNSNLDLDLVLSRPHVAMLLG